MCVRTNYYNARYTSNRGHRLYIPFGEFSAVSSEKRIIAEFRCKITGRTHFYVELCSHDTRLCTTTALVYGILAWSCSLSLILPYASVNGFCNLFDNFSCYALVRSALFSAQFYFVTRVNRLFLVTTKRVRFRRWM